LVDDITLQRLDDEIAWYDHRATRNQLSYRALKFVVIVAAALIPFLSGLDVIKPWPWLVGALGVIIAIAEGMQQVNQHHTNWTTYRATCEALKHEKYLYHAKAGPYADARDVHALLAERVEALISQETVKWALLQDSSEKKQTKSGGGTESA
jgi:hypothetical protein